MRRLTLLLLALALVAPAPAAADTSLETGSLYGEMSAFGNRVAWMECEPRFSGGEPDVCRLHAASNSAAPQPSLLPIRASNRFDGLDLGAGPRGPAAVYMRCTESVRDEFENEDCLEHRAYRYDFGTRRETRLRAVRVRDQEALAIWGRTVAYTQTFPERRRGVRVVGRSGRPRKVNSVDATRIDLERRTLVMGDRGRVYLQRLGRRPCLAFRPRVRNDIGTNVTAPSIDRGWVYWIANDIDAGRATLYRMRARCGARIHRSSRVFPLDRLGFGIPQLSVADGTVWYENDAGGISRADDPAPSFP